VQLAVGIGPFDLTQKRGEVGGGVAGTSLCGHLAGGDFESGKEARGAVAFVVVGVALDLPRFHRQHRRRPIESLDLGGSVENLNVSILWGLRFASAQMR